MPTGCGTCVARGEAAEKDRSLCLIAHMPRLYFQVRPMSLDLKLDARCKGSISMGSMLLSAASEPEPMSIPLLVDGLLG